MSNETDARIAHSPAGFYFVPDRLSGTVFQLSSGPICTAQCPSVSSNTIRPLPLESSELGERSILVVEDLLKSTVQNPIPAEGTKRSHTAMLIWASIVYK